MGMVAVHVGLREPDSLGTFSEILFKMMATFVTSCLLT